MPLLRWSHDHHRDLRARLPTQAPPHTRIARDQDRYLMMLPRSINNLRDTHHSRCFMARNVRARDTALDSQLGAPPISPSTMQPPTAALRPHRPLAANRFALALRANLLHSHPAAKSP